MSWPPTAHPRSRGENAGGRDILPGVNGSSPLTRGKLRSGLGSAASARLIPAHAGKTDRCGQSMLVRAAHPRSRGENRAKGRTRPDRAGSSPLTRGKHFRACEQRPCARLIPAHAGKTSRWIASAEMSAAHPRSRGENAVDGAAGLVLAGSSPLTRGKHFLTCAFTAQIDQILETLELAASFGSYLIWVACATDAPQDPVRSIGLVLPSSMGAS